MTDDLPFHYPSEATPNGAKGAKPCARHSWELCHDADTAWTQCARCGKLADPESRKRGRHSLRAGKEAERAIARAYGGTRTGQYGGPDDVLVRITVFNRGPEAARLRVLPTLWFRNTWSWGDGDHRPSLRAAGPAKPELVHG